MSTETSFEPETTVPEGYMPGKNGGLLMVGGEKRAHGGRYTNKTRQEMQRKSPHLLARLIDRVEKGTATFAEEAKLLELTCRFGMGEAKLAADEFAVLAGECFAEVVQDESKLNEFASLIAERLKLGG